MNYNMLVCSCASNVRKIKDNNALHITHKKGTKY